MCGAIFKVITVYKRILKTTTDWPDTTIYKWLLVNPTQIIKKKPNL